MHRFPIIAAVVLLCAWSQGTAAETLTVRADSWPPYNAEPGSDKPGYGIEIMQAIFGPQGITVDYQTMPWTRALDSVGKGDFNSVIGTDSDEAPDFIFPVASVGPSKNQLYVKAGSDFTFTSLDDLKAVKLGVIDEYSYTDDLDALIESGEVTIFASKGEDALEKLIKMLIAGRVDVVIESQMVMADALASAGATEAVKEVDFPEDEGYLIYVGFSPKKDTSQRYADLFDAGMASLRESGQLETIMARYGLTAWDDAEWAEEEE